MDYHLENKVLLSEESKYKSLYSWSLQEFDKEGKQVGCDMIPWIWSLYFTASELRHNYSINIYSKEESDTEEDPESTQDSENISGILHSGTCSDGKSLEDEVLYSMFGTNRIINHFRLSIRKANEGGEKPKCSIIGFVSYTSESDFRKEITDDDVYVDLILTPQQFNKIAELIKTKRVDILEIRLRGVSGFYSDWSPSISTNYIKILTDSDEHKVIILENSKIDPPRLGDVSEFNMTVIYRHTLNPRQDLRGINIDKLFEEDEDNENYETQESQLRDNSSLVPSQSRSNEISLKKLTIPIWLIFIILCFLFIKL